MQAIVTGTAGNRQRREEGRFEQQILSIVRHTRVLTTHNAGNGQRFGVVGDHQSVGVQFNVLAIEQRQFFALLCHANTNATVNLLQIESVHRLTQLQHHVW